MHQTICLQNIINAALLVTTQKYIDLSYRKQSIGFAYHPAFVAAI